MTPRERLAELAWVAKIRLLQAGAALFSAYDRIRGIRKEPTA